MLREVDNMARTKRVKERSFYFQQGWTAFEDGKPSTCPNHVPDEDRKDWYDGFFTHRVESKLGHILRSHGLSEVGTA